MLSKFLFEKQNKKINIPDNKPIENRIDVTSSNIKTIGYNIKTKDLDVEFTTGDIYRYSGVPKSVYRSFLGSSSKGKFLHKNIKGKYSYIKLAKK